VRPTLFRHVISFEEALARVRAAGVPIERTEVVGLEDADGRVAARDVTSTVDVPAFDRAAMDGYAVVAEDTRGAGAASPVTLSRVSAVFTGDAAGGALTRGQCVEVATGAPLPAGATAVVMVEQTDRAGDTVRIFVAAEAGQNIGRRGADMKRDDAAVRAGAMLTPSRVGAVAAVGNTMVEVYARPTVAILSTGNEVVPPGQPLAPGQVYDINRYTLATVVRRHGGTPVMLPIATDSLDALDRALDAVEGHDIAVFSGGSSVGGRDLMSDALGARGEIVFHGIAVKPGKPTLFGRVGRTLVFGMPGYPTSCLSNAYMLLVPLLRQIGRLEPWRSQTIDVPLERRVGSTADRHQFYTVRIVNGRARPAFKASGDITSMAEADGFIEVPVGVESVEEGAVVTVTLF
jgi:molybdenum cofactor synthesis domain-containing protein